MEKIDLTKCNNCRFKAKIDGIVTTGIISARDGLNAFLKNEQGYDVGCLTGAGLVDSDNRPITDFEIVPRDPETYQDWQVGDKIKRNSDRAYTVIFRCGEVVLYKYEEEGGTRCCTSPYICEELFRTGYRLVLTDIEKQIIKNKKYEPQDGDVVYAKVRHNDNDAVFIYKRAVENRIYGYVGYNIGLDMMVDTYGLAYITPKIFDDLIEYRPATDEEKQKLFDAMAKEGKRWNAEKKVVEDIPKPHEFKEGEPALVKDYDDNIWKLAAFRQMSGNASYPYEVRDERGNCCNHRKCIPYNEKTMHLLGTTEDYKEGE